MMQLTITSFKSDTTRFSARLIFCAELASYMILLVVPQHCSLLRGTEFFLFVYSCKFGLAQ